MDYACQHRGSPGQSRDFGTGRSQRVDLVERGAGGDRCDARVLHHRASRQQQVTELMTAT